MGLGSGVIVPAMFAMATSVWPEGGRRSFNAIYVAQNVGVALGASLGGFVAYYSFSYIFWANASLFILFYIIVFFTFKPMEKKVDANAYSTVFSKGLAIKNKKSFLALGFLSIGFFIAWVAYTQWQTTIASYTQDLGIPIDRYSVLWTINGAMIIAGQPLMKLITRWITSPKMQIVVGNTIFPRFFYLYP